MPCFSRSTFFTAMLLASVWAVDGYADADDASTHAADVPQFDVQPLPLPKAENLDLKEVVEEPLPYGPPVPTLPPAAGTVDNEKVDSTATNDPAQDLDAELPESVEPDGRSLVLLGTEVLPGTSTRLAWSPQESFAGIASPTPVLVVHGDNPGPKLCLTAAVHGDELNGIEVVRQVVYDLDASKLSGSVIGVPIVNLQGFRRASRYLADRRDLNRFFPGNASGSSASRIADSFFREVVQHCDLLVDLHTGSFQRTNLPQLRANLTNPGVAELASQMGAMVVLHSEGAEGSLRRAAMDAGIPAITIEAGEPHSVQIDAVNQGVKSIETLLHNRNMYAQRGLWARQTAPVYYKSLWVRASTGGVLISRLALGERVRKGEILGTIMDPITNRRSDVISPINGRVIGKALNQVMLPGYAAYHLGYQTTVEEATEQDAGLDETAGDETLSEDSFDEQSALTEESESGEVGE